MKSASASASEVHYLRPYPVEYFDSVVAPGEPIAIAGMGLVGYDLITALTIGRGGTYDEDGDRMRTTCRAVANPTSTSTRVPACRTAPSRRTASTRPATISPSCVPPRRFER